jgi:hypothetical protein
MLAVVHLCIRVLDRYIRVLEWCIWVLERCFRILVFPHQLRCLTLRILKDLLLILPTVHILQCPP